MGFIYWQFRRYEDALKAHRGGLEIHREVGDRVAASVELFNLGETLRQLRQHQEALRCLEEAQHILSTLEDPLGLVLCYYNIGNVYRDLGKYGTALQYYDETLASRLRQPYGTATLWCAPFMGIAMIQSQLGDHHEALKYYREALAISRRLGDHRDMIATLQPLAATHIMLGGISDALACYQEALMLSRALRDRHAEGSILANLGHLYRQQLRDFPAALTCYRQSLTMCKETGEGDGRLTLLKGLGAACWDLGYHEEAASAFEQALVIVEANGDRAEQAVIRSSLGVTALSLHRYATALTHLQKGLTIAKALEDPWAEGYIGVISARYAWGARRWRLGRMGGITAPLPGGRDRPTCRRTRTDAAACVAWAVSRVL